MDRLTGTEVIAALAARSVRMTPKKLKTYRMRGDIERPKQVHVEGVRGSKSLYPASVVDVLERLERAGQSKGLRSSSRRAVIAWIVAPSADARKARSIVNTLRVKMENDRASTEHPRLAEFLFNPPNALDAQYDVRLDEGFVLSESVVKHYRKDIQPLIDVAADIALAGAPIYSASRDKDLEIPNDARPAELLQASHLVGDDDVERGRLFLRRVYFVMKFYAQIAAKRGIPLEHIHVLEQFAPIGMLKTYFGSVDAFFAKIGPMSVLWLANQYRTNDDTFLKHIKSFMHPFEEAMLSLPEGQLAEILALEIPASSS